MAILVLTQMTNLHKTCQKFQYQYSQAYSCKASDHSPMPPHPPKILKTTFFFAVLKWFELLEASYVLLT